MRILMRLFSTLALLALLALPVLSLAADGEDERYFVETGHYVRGDFLAFFDAHGGLEVFGYPRTEQVVESGRTVQYFQRQKMEFWPENPAPFRVQLALLGDVVLGEGDPPIAADAVPTTGEANIRYYPETGHTIAGAILDFFDSRGGIDIFGYPTSEAKKEGGVVIQRFQRARLEQWEAGVMTLGLLGDEYIFRMGRVPAAMTAALSVTSAPSAASQTSPSQKAAATKIVFQKSIGGAIYSINPDGTGLKQIGTGMDPSLSVDGRKLVYASWDQPRGVFVKDLGKGESVLVTSAHEPRTPILSPDGSQLAFYVTKPGFRQDKPGQYENDVFFNITVLDLGTSKTWNPPAQTHNAFSPSWSPDGTQLVFKGASGLYISSAGSTQLIKPTDGRFSSPAWSPDGRRIAFMYHQHDHAEVGIINFDGSGFHLLTSSPPFTKAANNVAPAWSPDGSQLVFVSDRDSTWKLYAMNADGSDQRKLTDETVNYEWAAERVAFWGMD